MAYRQFMIIAIGSIMEWYDLSLFGYLIPQISSTFSPIAHEHMLNMVYVFFAIGFIFRPLGGILFGYIGDAKGYAYSINLSTVLVTATSLLTGCIPGYASIGHWGIGLLIMCRILQSLFSGSQIAGLITYSNDYGRDYHHDQQNLFAAIAYSTSIIGVLLASLVTTVVVNWFEASQIAWRLPYFLTLPIAIIYFKLIRKQGTPKHSPRMSLSSFKLTLVMTFKVGGWQLLQLSILMACCGSLYYILFFYFEHFMEQVLHYPQTIATLMNTISLVISILALAVGGMIADKIVNKYVLTIAFLSLFLIFIVLMFNNLANSYLFCLWLLLAIGAYWCALSSFLLVFANSFPRAIRMSACAMAINLGGIISGSSPLIANFLVNANWHYLLYYIAIICIIIITIIINFQKK